MFRAVLIMLVLGLVIAMQFVRFRLAGDQVAHPHLLWLALFAIALIIVLGIRLSQPRQ